MYFISCEFFFYRVPQNRLVFVRGIFGQIIAIGEMSCSINEFSLSSRNGACRILGCGEGCLGYIKGWMGWMDGKRLYRYMFLGIIREGGYYLLLALFGGVFV